MKLSVVLKSSLFALSLGLTSCAPYVVTRPADPTVVVPVSPSPGHIWVSGSWRWNSNIRQYSYAEGYWAPPGRHRAWVEGRWVQGRRGYRYAPGRWR